MSKQHFQAPRPPVVTPPLEDKEIQVSPNDVDGETFEDRDALLVEVMELFEIRDGESDQGKAWKQQVAAYCLDRAGILPRGSISKLFSKEAPWFNSVLSSVNERLQTNWTFRQYVDRKVRELKVSAS